MDRNSVFSVCGQCVLWDCSLKVTQLKAQVKNPQRVSVFVDGKYSFSLTFDQVLEQKIKKDLELERADIERLRKMSDEGKQKARALEWLMMRPHSTRELREYGFRKKIEKDLVEAWIVEFQEKRYIDDENFAHWFAENRIRKNKSRRAIVSELASKGIDSSVAQAVVASLSNEKNTLDALIKKLRSRSRYSDDQKLTVYLLGKGFGYQDVKDAFKREQEQF